MGMGFVRAALVLLACLLWSAGLARADSDVGGRVDLGATFGGGFERGAGRGGSAVVGAPLFLDLNGRVYPSVEADYAVGGSLRAELTGAGSIGIVPRVELRYSLGEAELRPGLGAALHIIPMALVGPEVSLGLRIPLGYDFALQALAFVDAFVAGDNLPRKTTLVLLGLSFGVELRL